MPDGEEIQQSPEALLQQSPGNLEQPEELTPAPAMATCKRCGERMPRTSMATHYSQKHPERLNAYQRLLGAPRGKQRLG